MELAKELYWKYNRRARFANYVAAGLQVLSFALVLFWIFTDLPTMTENASEKVHLRGAVKGLLAAIPWFMALAIDLVVSNLSVPLACKNCKHLLHRHENSKGEAHVCKKWHFDMNALAIKRCDCQTFVMPDKL